ncbi:MAG: hypothetical protein ACLP9L_06780 [Thermoguttaceae bacterium]
MKELRDLTLEQLVQIADEHFVDNLTTGNLVDPYADNVARHVVFAMQRERGTAFLGLTYIPRGSFLPPLRRWEGERLPAFSADFVVSVEDDCLAQMIADYNAIRDHARILEIHGRIEQLGGVLLHWFGESQDEEPQNHLRIFPN